MGAIDDIAAERGRQIDREGWSRDHDDTHSNGELAMAAGTYAWIAGQSDEVRQTFIRFSPPTWPEEWSDGWWKPTDRRRDLVKAGALIVAEIERLDRKTSPPMMQFHYKNHRGEVSLRTITSVEVYWGSTEWYPEPQWLMRAMDHDKGAERVFAIANILSFKTTQLRPMV
jgi:hypothetical protein